MNDVDLFKNIRELIDTSRKFVITEVNRRIVYTYFEIGRLIVEHEQKGKIRAQYSKKILRNLSNRLQKEYGKGFSLRNLKYMRLFFLTYSIGQTVSAQSQITKKVGNYSEELIRKSKSSFVLSFHISWSHYVLLLKLDTPARQFYEIEAYTNNWSVRELNRQINSMLYERLALSRDKEKVLELSKKGQIVQNPKDLIKDPYIFEFLGLKQETSYTEKELETKLIDNLQEFLLELGKGFTFVSRQQRIVLGEKNFYIDLVFYNRILKCFVIIDLKIGELTHQDLGQLQMYVNYYDRQVKESDENKTIGILLCASKEESVVEMTLPKENMSIYASKYRIYLPSKEDLIKQISIV